MSDLGIWLWLYEYASDNNKRDFVWWFEFRDEGHSRSCNLFASIENTINQTYTGNLIEFTLRRNMNAFRHISLIRMKFHGEMLEGKELMNLQRDDDF